MAVLITKTAAARATINLFEIKKKKQENEHRSSKICQEIKEKAKQEEETQKNDRDNNNGGRTDNENSSSKSNLEIVQDEEKNEAIEDSSGNIPQEINLLTSSLSSLSLSSDNKNDDEGIAGNDGYNVADIVGRMEDEGAISYKIQMKNDKKDWKNAIDLDDKLRAVVAKRYPEDTNILYPNCINICGATILAEEWHKLEESKKKNFVALGWTPKSWNKSPIELPNSFNKHWWKLDQVQRQAASDLGFKKNYGMSTRGQVEDGFRIVL